MTDNKILLSNLKPIGDITGLRRPSTQQPDAASKVAFDALLVRQLDAHKVSFSQHATSRLSERGIQIDQGQMDRLASTVDAAEAKGAKESLVLMDNVALIVSIKNRVVVTAMDRTNMKENIVTNIDSAVFI